MGFSLLHVFVDSYANAAHVHTQYAGSSLRLEVSHLTWLLIYIKTHNIFSDLFPK